MGWDGMVCILPLSFLSVCLSNMFFYLFYLPIKLQTCFYFCLLVVHSVGAEKD